MEELVKRELNESILVKKAILARNVPQIIKLAKMVVDSYNRGGRLIAFGNGGSAADAQHIVAELVNYLYNKKRPMLDALALTVNTSVISAIGNDIGYENVFSKQIESLATKKDVILGITTSGNSVNVINGLKKAKENGAICVALTGKGGGKLNELDLDLMIKIQSDDVARIQEGHITVGHVMCSLVEKELFLEKKVNVKKIQQNFVEVCVPVRVSLANGGDTDSIISKIGKGCVVNATLSSHFYKCRLEPENSNDVKVFVNNLFEGKKYNYIINGNNLDGGLCDLIKATLKRLSPDYRGIIYVETNVPIMSGLGGSSAFNVALIKALYKLQDKKINPEEIAKLSYQIERKDLNIAGGYQDQWAAAYGGFNFLEFTNEGVKVNPINFEKIDEFEKNILLVYIGKREFSGDEIHKDQIKNMENTSLGIRDLLLQRYFNTENFKNVLINGKLEDIGKIMHKDFMIKKQLSSKISNPRIDEIYQIALANGATGGRISGAGAGGCALFYCKEGMKEHLSNILQKYGAKIMPFKFERK